MVDRIATYSYIQNMVKKRTIEFVEIPKRWRKSQAVKLLYEGSRWYVEYGKGFFEAWVNELYETDIKPIPLQYVPEYVGVSREAVLKRAKNGGLTVFSYVFPEYVETIFGKGKKKRDSKKRVDFVPKSECDQWMEILMEASERGESKDE